MAKSLSGGTRSYLRGRVGADVYSIGKNGKGQKQQVVRSLAETVSNPQTLAQMKGRCIMATIMQAVSALSALVDHSFDNVSVGQPSISEFIRVNYARVKADVQAHPSTANTFGINKYGEKGIKLGAYQISAGSVEVPAPLSIANGVMVVSSSATIANYGALKSLLGLNAGDCVTLVDVTASSEVRICRLTMPSAAQDATELTVDNFGTIMNAEGTENFKVTTSEAGLQIGWGDSFGAAGLIVSKKVDTGFKHSQCILNLFGNATPTYSVAIETYPQGNARFLNGGDAMAKVSASTGNVFFTLNSVTAAGTSILAENETAHPTNTSVAIAYGVSNLAATTAPKILISETTDSLVGADLAAGTGVVGGDLDATSGTFNVTVDLAKTYRAYLVEDGKITRRLGLIAPDADDDGFDKN